MNLFKTLAITFTIAALTGCASSPNTDLDAKVTAEKSINNGDDLHSEVVQLIKFDDGLTADQKSKLEALHNAHVERLAEIGKKSFELRSVLVKDLLAKPYNAEEVNSIKARLRKLEDGRLTSLFETIDKANAVLGHDAIKHARMMRAFMEHGHDAEK